MRLSDLPSATQPPQGHPLGKEWKQAKRRTTRREFFNLVIRASLATGLAFVSLMPTARRAWATHRTKTSTHQQSVYCSSSRNGWAGNTGCCECGSHVSRAHCDTDDWHRHHRLAGSHYVYYYRQEARCGTKDPNDQIDLKYAWLWRRGGTNWRCSDGEYKYCVPGNERSIECTSWQPSVCPAPV